MVVWAAYSRKKYHKKIEDVFDCKIEYFAVRGRREETITMSNFERELLDLRAKFNALEVLYEHETGNKSPFAKRAGKRTRRSLPAKKAR